MSDWYRVLITGSRDWRDRLDIDAALDLRLMEYGSITVVHGDCPTGADLFARQWAEHHVLVGMGSVEALVRHEAYPALWAVFDKHAGPIRNRYMVQLGANECVAFPGPRSRGTISCMDLAAAAGIPVTNLGVQR